MRRTLVGLWALAAISGTSLGAAGAEQTGVKLVVRITQVEDAGGPVRCALFADADGFPGKPEKAAQRVLAPSVSNGVATCTFEGLAPGEYAVSVHHDENDNGKMDSNFFGVPKEGYGASNDAKGSMGPPKFKDAVFQVASEPKTISLKMQY